MTFNQAAAPTQWYQETEMLNDEDFFAAIGDFDIMEVDQQIGSNLLADDIFGDGVSPIGPLDNLALTDTEDDISEAEESISSQETTSSQLFDERYVLTLQKLQESMKRSEKTRKYLKVKTKRTAKYARRKRVRGVLSSIENSSRQVQSYLKTLQWTM